MKSSSIFHSIILLSCFFACRLLQAQPIYPARDSIRTDGLRIAVDVWGPVSNFWQTNERKYELWADYSIDSYSLIGEVGYASNLVSNENFRQEVQSQFLRLGIEKSFFRFSDDAMVLGIRHVFGRGDFNVPNILLQNNGVQYNASLPQSSFIFNWIEATTGLRARLFNDFYALWTIRLAYNYGGLPTADANLPAVIGGFGSTFDRFNLGITYGIGYKFVSRKRPYPTEIKK